MMFVLLHGNASADSFTRPAMLEAMARNCILRGLNDLATGAEKLSSATEELQKNPGPESLKTAQKAWVELHLIHKRNQMLFHGPVKDRVFWTSLFFRQAYPNAVENVIRSAKPIDADFIEVLGSSARGFYVIEYLLFDLPQGNGIIGSETKASPRLSAQLILESPTVERRRMYIRELARDLQKRLHGAAAEAQSSDFAKKFSDGGQDSINLLVNQVTDGVEGGMLLPLNMALEQLTAETLRYDALEGVASSTSLSSLLAMLDGLHRYHLGGDGLGIDDYVKHVNQELAARLEAQFKSTESAVAAIKLPLEKALVDDRTSVESAVEELKKLELMYKVDVVAALGVTIIFSSNDGD
jgi:predicted lipoprotein